MNETPDRIVHPAGAKKTPGRAALASWIGSALEYYDFFIYGTAAALVFSKVFFPASDPATGTLLALATFGVGYVARPIGAFFCGHIGDRYGRKKVLIGTLLLMGTATFLVGCLPTYGQIGVWAPIALVALRLLQGLSASGEQPGAASMTLEHSPERRRAFFTSFTLGGSVFGSVLATTAFLPIAALPEDQLLSWGWRVPFWLSFIVVVVGLIIRRKLEEAPVFKEEAEHHEIPAMPLAVLFRAHKVAVIRVALTALVSTVSTIFGVYALSFAVNTVGIDRSLMLIVAVVTNLVALVTIPLWAILADKIGRKPVYLLAIIGSGLLMWIFLSVIATADIFWIFTIAILMSGIVYQAHNAVFPAFYSEMFPTKVRLSGMAIGTQIGFAISGFAPSIATAVAGPGAAGWVPVGIVVLIACAISAAACMTAKETHKMTLAEIDGAASKNGKPALITEKI
jgi:MFS family permease